MQIHLGPIIDVDINSGSSVFDQISRVMHVRFRATDISPPMKAAPVAEPAHKGHKHTHDREVPTTEYTRALDAAPPPFAPQVLELRGEGTVRQACFCRQTLKTVTLIVLVAAASRASAVVAQDGQTLHIAYTVASEEKSLVLALHAAVQGTAAHVSVSSSNLVIVLEKTDPCFWPSVSTPVIATRSESLRF